MEENCRIVITIPARQEGKIIKGALEKFLNQKDRSGNLIDPALFEIVLVDNHPENEPADDTKQQVDEFMRNHPEIRLSYAHKAWKSGEGNVGRARKYATDLALFRDSNRSRQNGDLILVNNDADIDGLSDEYVFEMINQFDTYKDVDAVAAKWTLPPEALAKPNLRAAERLWYILDRVIQKDLAGIPGGRNIRAPGLIGRNSAFRTSIYAAVGGFNPNATLAEDLEMGWMINQGRGNDPTRFKFVNRAEVVSNPRRFLAAWFQNTPLIQMYGGFHENTAVRSMDNQQLLASVPDTLDSARFETEADALWRAAKDPQGQYSWLGPRFDDLFKRTMEFMDVDYQIEDRLDADGVTRSHVKITETARLVAGMARNKANRVP